MNSSDFLNLHFLRIRISFQEQIWEICGLEGLESFLPSSRQRIVIALWLAFMDSHFSDVLDKKLWWLLAQSLVIEDLVQSIPFVASTEMPPKKQTRLRKRSMGVGKLFGVWLIVHETAEWKYLTFELQAYEGLRFGQFRVTPRWGKEE